MIPFRFSLSASIRTTALQRMITATVVLIAVANVAMAQRSEPINPQQPFPQQQQPPFDPRQQQALQQQPQQQYQQPPLPQQQAPQQGLQYSEPIAQQQQQAIPSQSLPFQNGQSAGQMSGPAATFATGSVTTNSTPVAPASQISVCQEFHCEYVIDLLFRNQFRQQAGAFGTELAPGLVLSAPPSADQPGDLELVNVAMLSDASPTQGPILEVVVRNHSPRAIGDFQISVVGVTSQIHAQCPTARGLVSQLGAGSVGVFQLQLPATAVSNGPQDQQPIGFETFIVAVDSFDELMEANELNNVRIVRRSELLAMIAPQIMAPQMTVVQGSPLGLNTLPTSPTGDEVPSTPPVLSPLDSLMQEDSRLETTQPTAVGTMQLRFNAGQ